MIIFPSRIWYLPLPLIWFGLSSNQTQFQGLSWWCFFSWCFTWVHLHVLWSDQYCCLVQTTYGSIFLECSDKFDVEPNDDILIFSKLRLDSCGIIGINVGNFWEPSRSHLEVCVLDVRSDLLRSTCKRWKMSSWIRVQLTPYLKGTVVFCWKYLMYEQLSLDKLLIHGSRI